MVRNGKEAFAKGDAQSEGFLRKSQAVAWLLPSDCQTESFWVVERSLFGRFDSAQRQKKVVETHKKALSSPSKQPLDFQTKTKIPTLLPF